MSGLVRQNNGITMRSLKNGNSVINDDWLKSISVTVKLLFSIAFELSLSSWIEFRTTCDGLVSLI